MFFRYEDMTKITSNFGDSSFFPISKTIANAQHFFLKVFLFGLCFGDTRDQMEHIGE